MEIRLKRLEHPRKPIQMVLNADEKAVRHAISMFGLRTKGDFTAFVLDKVPLEGGMSERCKVEKKSAKALAKMTVAKNPIAILFDASMSVLDIVVAAHGKAS